ncbi:hypothetical protein HPB48_000300 [Haemaphysalis longicornis]|uniref:THAP-type domain-containing protein n=1 Tax=Haemaphysalis longicornis TaxID=44386 RepID=A0A9J6FWG5_HAELO|nr:hypothetical protein HPB48_000300 [Haemaphysalis longicornis]
MSLLKPPTVVVVADKPQHHRCITPGCPSLKERRKVRFFRLPADEQRRNQWLSNCGREDLRCQPGKVLCTKTLCQLHFHDSQFMNTNTYQRLIWNAVPTLFGKDVRKVEEFSRQESGGSPDHAYTVSSAPLRHYMSLCADLRGELAEKDKRLRALEKSSDSVVDSVIRQVRALPLEKQQQVVSSLNLSVQLQGDGVNRWTHSLPSETWEAAAVRATRQEAGLTLVEPRVCSVVETVQASEGHHWVSVFMAGHVAEPGAQPTAPKDAVCTGGLWAGFHTPINTD